MSVTLPMGASARAILLASKIEVISVTSDIGVAAAIVAPVVLANDKTRLVRRAAVAMADKNGRFLSGHVDEGFLPSPGFALINSLVSYLDILRRWPSEYRQYHASCLLNLDESDGQTASGLPLVVAELLTESLLAVAGKPQEDERFLEDFHVLASALNVEWRRVVVEVLKALSLVERAAVVATRNCVMFDWDGYSACAKDTEAGKLSREFVSRNPALGCLFLSVPAAMDLVASGADDRVVLKEACTGKVFERGKHNEAARIARIRLDALRWKPAILKTFVKIGLPLDWLPRDTVSANDAGLAFSVAAAMGLIAGSGRPFAGLDPFSGCGSDWRDFAVRMFDASGLDESAPHSWDALTKLASSGSDMAWDARIDLVVPAIAAYGGDEGMDMLSVLEDINWGAAATLSFTRWLLFRGSSAVACLKRSKAYAKAAKRRRAVLAAYQDAKLTTFVWTETMPGFARKVDGIRVSIVGIARVGTEAERRFVEGYISHNDKWESRKGDLVRYPADDGEPKSRISLTSVVRVPASTPEGQVAVLTAVAIGDGDEPPTYERVVEAICGGEPGLQGDVLLEMADVVEGFSGSLPPHLNALTLNPRTSSFRVLGAPRLGSCYRESSDVGVEAAFSAWKNALPRRLRVESASEFAAVVMDDLRAYLSVDGVQTVISAAAPRLAARKRISERMVGGMNSHQAAMVENI